MKRSVWIAALVSVAIKMVVLLGSILWIKTHHQIPEYCSWDCGYYREIAVAGYRETPGHHGPMAFFPLFPLTIKFLGGNSVASFAPLAIGFNLLCFAMCIALLGRWCQQLKLRYWWLPGLMWTCDRYTLWSHVPYTESLFCLLMLTYVWAMRSERRTVGLFFAASLGGLASATRIVGLSLVTALGLSDVRRWLRQPFFALLLLVLGASGTALFFSYLQIEFGSWRLSFQTTAAWGRHFSFAGLVQSVTLLLKSFYIPTVPLLVATVAAIAKPRSFLSSTERWLFALLALVPMASSVQVSLTRYLSILVIGYVFFAHFLGRQPRSKWTWALVSVFLASEVLWQLALTVKFFRSEVFQWAG